MENLVKGDELVANTSYGLIDKGHIYIFNYYQNKEIMFVDCPEDDNITVKVLVKDFTKV